MGFNIENLVKVIKDFGIILADNLDDFDNDETLNIELSKVKNESRIFQEAFNEYLENQIKINFDTKLFNLILEELKVVEAYFYVRYHKIRQSNNLKELRLKSIVILREIEHKISIIHIVTDKLELNKKYSGYLGISESKTLDYESKDESTIIKGDWNVRQVYYYLEKLKIIDLLSKQFPNKEHRHHIVSKIIPLHHTNIKKLSYGTYKGIEISSEDKKEVDSFIQKYS
jgi:hypothetical protein